MDGWECWGTGRDAAGAGMAQYHKGRSKPGRPMASAPARVRLAALAAALAAGAAAFLVRKHGAGFAAKFVPDALWASGVLFLVAAVFPGWRLGRLLAVTLAGCVTVELVQLSPLPGWLSALWPPLRFVFGTTFHDQDLLAYLTGAALGALLLAAARRAAAGAPR